MTGATVTLNGYKEAVGDALNKAVNAKEPEIQVPVSYVDGGKNQVLRSTTVTLSGSGRIEYDPALIPAGYEVTGNTYVDITVTDGRAEPGSVIFFVTPAATPTPAPTAAPTRKPYPAAGQYIRFGRYPQTAEGTDEAAIDWLVLEVDEKNHKALLISKYGLDAKPYNTTYTSATWEKSTLRSWLNVEFRSKAFTAQERECILMTDVDNSSSQSYSRWNTDSGNNTRDKIFLLSYAEANKYLGVTYEDIFNTRSRVAATAYAIKQGARTSGFTTEEGTMTVWWWLRSPGASQRYASRVLSDGSLNDYDVIYDSGCVRPALWLDLDSGLFDL